MADCTHDNWIIYAGTDFGKCKCTDCGLIFPVSQAFNRLHNRMLEALERVNSLYQEPLEDAYEGMRKLNRKPIKTIPEVTIELANINGCPVRVVTIPPGRSWRLKVHWFIGDRGCNMEASVDSWIEIQRLKLTIPDAIQSSKERQNGGLYQHHPEGDPEDQGPAEEAETPKDTMQRERIDDAKRL